VGRGRVLLRRSEWNVCIFVRILKGKYELARLNCMHGLGVKWTEVYTHANNCNMELLLYE
jgi:hypothetical protein